jgi:hypothetical protein
LATGGYGIHPGLCRLYAARDLMRVNLQRVKTDVFPYGADQHYIFDFHLTCFIEAEGDRPLAQLR